MVSANRPHAIATAKDHLDQTRQVTKRHTLKRLNQSIPKVSLETLPNDDFFNDPDICVKTYDLKDPIHADLTGRFPIVSLKGNQYLLVACWHGYFHFELMASRKAECYVRAYTKILAFFRGLGLNPSVLRLDNETSGKLEAYLKSEKVEMQFVPPGVHRANKAERAIRTSKNHIISMLCGAHADFDLKLWDESIEQAEITLNHLVPYALNSTLCAYDGLHSHPYDFVAHPIAPFGTLVLVHEKPADRGTWDPHGVKGWYLGPAMQHHHCWRTWIIHTQATRITDTVEWFPSPLKMPGKSPHAMVTAALHDLATAVKVFPDNTQVSRDQLEVRVTSATDALRAVIDLFEPPAPNDLQRVLERDILVDSQEVSAQPDTVAPQRVSAQVGPVCLEKVLDSITSSLTPDPVLALTLVTTSSPPVKTRGRPKGVPTVGPTTVHTPTPLGPPLCPTVTQRLLSQRTRKPSFKGKSNGYHKPNHPSDADRASANRSHGIVFEPVNNGTAVCTALSRTLGQANAALNLNPDGSPLTYRSALHGPNGAHWRQEEGNEICKLIDTETIHPVLPSDQPHDRRQDTTYYNPQVREKPGLPTISGEETTLRRVRGTIGGDHINYPDDFLRERPTWK